MRSGTYFEIEIEAFGDTGVEKMVRVSSEAEVLSFAKENLQPRVEILVACLGGGVDFGNLIIQVDEFGVCGLQALEHRSFFVKGISVKQAVEALECWLPSQDRMPSLQWLEE